MALAVCLILLFAGLFFANYRENGGELLGVNIFKQKSRLFMEGGTFKSPRKRKRYLSSCFRKEMILSVDITSLTVLTIIVRLDLIAK